MWESKTPTWSWETNTFSFQSKFDLCQWINVRPPGWWVSTVTLRKLSIKVKMLNFIIYYPLSGYVRWKAISLHSFLAEFDICNTLNSGNWNRKSDCRVIIVIYYGNSLGISEHMTALTLSLSFIRLVCANMCHWVMPLAATVTVTVEVFIRRLSTIRWQYKYLPKAHPWHGWVSPLSRCTPFCSVIGWTWRMQESAEMSSS